MPDDLTNTWCILELMGHRRLAGRVSEATIAGQSLLRVDVPGPGDQALMTQYYSPSAIYSLTPTTEEVARELARRWTEPPATPFDLRALLPPGAGATADARAPAGRGEAWEEEAPY